MKKSWIAGTLLVLAGIAGAAPAVKQKVYAGLNKTSAQGLETFPAARSSVTRFAFPYKTAALAVDAYRPVKPEKVVIRLTRFESIAQKDAEMAGLVVYAGNEPGKLVKAEGIKVDSSVSADGKIDTVTVTGLPEARFFQFYVPRTKVYVFGIQNVTKDVDFFADAPVMKNPEMAQFPEASTLDADWDKDSIPLVKVGGLLKPTAAEVGNFPFKAEYAKISLAFPYQNRAVEFSLKEKRTLNRIVLVLDKVDQTRKETDPEMGNAVVYVSDDGVKFTAVKPAKVSPLVYRVTDAKGTTLFSRVTLSGSFTGKYFRVTVPRAPKAGYVFRIYTNTDRIKAF